MPRITSVPSRMARLAVAIAAFLAASASPRLARPQDQDNPKPGADLALPGRLFLGIASREGETDRGIVSLDPNDCSWRMISNEKPSLSAGLFTRVSPDGRYLAHNRANRADVDPGLWISKTTGDPEPYRASERTGYICWSHDGSSLFITPLTRGEVEVWRVHFDGTPDERLPFKLMNEIVVDQSPDGSFLLKGRHANGGNPLGHRGITLIQPDGSGRRELTSHPQEADFKPFESLQILPRFSPDGRTVHSLLCQTEPTPDPSRHRITKTCLIDLDVESGRWHRYAEKDSLDGGQLYACWSPDGKMIAARSYTGSNDGPDNPPLSTLVILDREGKLLKRMPWPKQLRRGQLFDWR